MEIIEQIKKFASHIRKHSRFSNQIKQDLTLLFLQFDVNSKGKKIFDYKILFKLKESKLDGFLMNKLRSIARLNGVNHLLIEQSKGENISYLKRAEIERFNVVEKKQSQNDYSFITDVYNAGKYAGRSFEIFHDNNQKVTKLINEVFKQRAVNNEKEK